MREIEWSTKFKRDFKREKKKDDQLELKLKLVIQALAADKPLIPKYFDHALSGNWQGCRDCHIKPDLILIYQKTSNTILSLIRLASHANLKL